MPHWLFYLALALLVSVLSFKPLQALARTTSLYDRPNGDPLKIHKLPTPLTGGLSIALAVGLSTIFWVALVETSWLGFLPFACAGGLALGLGLWDDRLNIHPRVRLLLEFGIAGLFWILAWQVGLIKPGDTVGIVLLPVGILFVVGFMNATNMQDGLDGLAGGLTLISFAGFFVIALLEQQTVPLVLSVCFTGATAGFLVFNFEPARVFMGDSGSYLLGFTLAALFGVHAAENLSFLNVLGGLFILGVPLFDFVYAIIRRWWSGQSLFQGDREHAYDRCVAGGWSVRRTVLTFWMFQLGSVVLGSALIYWGG